MGTRAVGSSELGMLPMHYANACKRYLLSACDLMLMLRPCPEKAPHA